MGYVLLDVPTIMRYGPKVFKVSTQSDFFFHLVLVLYRIFAKITLHVIYMLRLNLEFYDSNFCFNRSNLAFTPNWAHLPKQYHHQTTCTRVRLLLSIE